MATATTITLVALLLHLILITTSSVTPQLPPPPQPPLLIPTILSTLGFATLSTAATNLSTTMPIPIPTTIFAPTDTSLLTCPSCTLTTLLQEHSIQGLYPSHFLKTLPFATKILTLAPRRCLTLTSSPSTTATTTRQLFINGVQITKPDLFNNGLIIMHSIQGFLSHLSPLSCNVENMVTLSFPPQPPPIATFFAMRVMLRDAMARLRTGGYSVAGLSMRVKYSELLELERMTLFAVDDETIFLEGNGGGHAYVEELGFHVVPNRVLTEAEMMRLPRGEVLTTMERGGVMVVTTAGAGGPLVPMKINYVKVKRFDLVSNGRIVVHALSMPLRHLDRDLQDYSRPGNGMSPVADVERRDGL